MFEVLLFALGFGAGWYVARAVAAMRDWDEVGDDDLLH